MRRGSGTGLESRPPDPALKVGPTARLDPLPPSRIFPRVPIPDDIRRILGRPAPTAGSLDRKLSPRLEATPASAPVVEDPIEILPEYRQVEDLLAAEVPLTFVTGGAGTGKSTFIRWLVSRRPGDVVVLAPTGVAALNVGGMTIHSFCRFPPAIVRASDIKPAADRRLASRMKLLVLDEVSMLRPDLLDAIDVFFRRSRDRDVPFGGLPVVLVGDLFQLPPVTTREEAPALREMGYACDWFFSARCIRDTPLASVILTRIFRQKDPKFAALLNEMRVAANVEKVTRVLNTRVVAPGGDGPLNLTLTATNTTADERNRRALERLPGPERLYDGVIVGDFGMGQARLPSPVDLRLRVGSQVMFTKNDDARRFVNGTLGSVVAMHEEGVTVLLDEGEKVEGRPASWERYGYSYNTTTDQIDREVVARYTQLPLMLAWAVTIHKAQGKTLTRATVDLGRGAFASGQAYVAVSRVRSLEDLRLAAPLRSGDVRCDAVVKEFYREIGGGVGD